MELKLYIKACRPWAFPASIVPILFGGVFASYDGFFHPLLFFFSLIGGMMVHAGTNLVNDYFDYMEGVDTPVSSQCLLPRGKITPEEVKKLAILCFFIAGLIGIYFVYLAGPFMALIILLGMLGGYGYTGRPFSLKYRALGNALVFLMMGPLMVLGAYFIQTKTLSLQVTLASIPIGLLVTAILHSNDLRDVTHDKKVGIKTLSMLLGEKRSKLFFYILVHGAYSLIILYAVTGILSPINLVTLLTWPGAIKLTNYVKKSKPSELIPVDLMTAKLHLSFGMIYATSIIFASIL